MLHFFWVLFFFCFSFFSVICSTARTFDVCILCANNYIIIILIVRLPSVPEWTFLESYEQLTDLFIYLFIYLLLLLLFIAAMCVHLRLLWCRCVGYLFVVCMYVLYWMLTQTVICCFQCTYNSIIKHTWQTKWHHTAAYTAYIINCIE